MFEPESNPVSDSGSASGAGAGTAPEEASSLGTLVQVLVSPREAFAWIARRPRFALALALVALSAAVAIFVSMQKVDAGEMIRALEEQGQEFPPEVRDDPEAIKAMSVWGGAVWSLIALPAMLCVEAAIFLVLFRLFGSELTFRQSAATAVYGSLPLAVAALVGMVVVLGRDQVGFMELQWGGIVASNLGFLADEETGKVTLALLTSIDLFSAWCIALLAIGYRIVARVGAGLAWSVVGALWAVGILLKLGMAAAF